MNLASRLESSVLTCAGSSERGRSRSFVSMVRSKKHEASMRLVSLRSQFMRTVVGQQSEGDQ